MLASVLHFYSGQPLQNLSGVDTRVAPLLLIPIDCGHRVFWRELTRGFACVVVDCTQASHACICYVRAMLAGDLVVARCHDAWIKSKYQERLVKPIGHQPLDMVTIVNDCRPAETFAHHMRILVPLPSVEQRRDSIYSLLCRIR